MNPLDLSGPSFLMLYVVGWAGLAIAAYLVRKIAQSSDSAPTRAEMANLHPYEMAYLMRGPEGAVQSSVAALVASRYLVAYPNGLQSVALDPRSLTYFHPLDQGVLHQCIALRTPVGLSTVLRGTLDQIRDSLQARGLLLVEGTSKGWRRLILACGVGLILFGGMKVVVGISRQRPVGFLIVLIAISVVVLVKLAKPWPRWTSKGEQAKRDLVTNHGGLYNPSRPISPVEVAMAAGIFGIGALGLALGESALPALFPLTPGARREAGMDSDDDWSGSSCSSSSCSSSSCSSSSCSSSSCSSSSCGGGGGCGGCGSS